MEEYPQVLYIDPPDDVENVKEKIIKSKRRKIILVLPEENKNLKNIESLTILQREAQIADKEISIYTTDTTYKKLAEDCGIAIEEGLVGGSFLNKKGEVSFRPPVSDILPGRREEVILKKPKEKLEGQKKEKEVEKEEEKKVQEFFPASKEKKEEDFSKNKTPKNKALKTPTTKKIKPSTIFYLVSLILLIGVGIFAYFWLPSADITLYPATDEINFSGSFWVKKDAKLDLENSVIPGSLIEKEKTIEKSFSPSQEKETAQKARGEIIVYNKSTSPYRFVPGTRFQSSDGKIFKSLDWISIPAGNPDNPSKVEVLVEAEEAGEEYNIKPSTFTLPGLQGTVIYNLVYGKSEKEMSGGFVGKAKIVSEEDILEAEREMKALQEKAVEDLKEEIFKDLPENLDFLKEAVVIDKEEIAFDKKAGDAGEIFKGKTSVKIKLLTFKEEDVRKIISEIVKGEVKDGVEFQEVLSSQVVNYQISEAQGWTEAIHIEFKGNEKVAWKIDEEEVKQKIMGKTYEEFQKYIQEEMKGKIKDSNFVLSPFWTNRIPTRPERVKITVKYE